MNNIFLLDLENDIEFTYSELLFEINSSAYFRPYLKTSSIKEFFTNLILGLVTGNEVILLDPDFTEYEIEDLLGSVDHLNKKVPVKVVVENMEQILNKISNSNGIISLFTSGTTGLPKKVTHIVDNLIRSVRISKENINNVWALAYNPTHMAGLQVFFQSLYNLNPMVYIFSKSRDNIFNSIEKIRITHISATPTFYRMLLPPDKSFNSVNRITFGGEKSDNVLHDKMLSLFPNARINNIYASTEAGAILTARNDEFGIKKEFTGKVKLQNNEIIIHCSIMGKGDDLKLDGEWYHTNDIVEITSQEPLLFKIVSRGNELISVGGNKVNPNEVENYILKVAGVKK